LSLINESGYNDSEKSFISEFSRRIFRLDNPEINEKLKEEYNMVELRNLKDVAADLRKEEAHEKGLAEGLAKGEAKGLAKGEAKAKLEIARAMLLEATAPDTISRVTGLSIQEVSLLKNQR
jgi:predicted transposase/invertase (TIGR01784 family)